MPMDPAQMPEWNAGDAAASLRAFAAWLNETARATFLEHGTHVELYFLFNGAGLAGVLPPQAGMGKEQMLQNLKTYIHANDIHGVAHVAEAWGYFSRRPGDHTFRQIEAGEIAVAELKPEDRSAVLLVTAAARDRINLMYLNPIVRAGDRVSLGEALARLSPLTPDSDFF